MEDRLGGRRESFRGEARSGPRRLVSTSAWRGYLQNLGVWTGKRALCNARGKVLLDVPVRVLAERFRSPEGEDCVVWRTSIQTESGIDEAEEEWSREELGDLGALTNDGSFSAGDDCFVGSSFCVDSCIFHEENRVRSTFAYDWEGRLTGVVASRERKQPSQEVARNDVVDMSSLTSDIAVSTPPHLEPAAWRSPMVLLDYSIGLWDGRGVVLDARTYVTKTVASKLELRLETGNILIQRTQLITENRPSLVVESRARLEANTALFPEANLQLMLLPGGVTISSPIRIQAGVSFGLEVSFMLRPDYRKRILRCYDEKSEWIKTLFLSERRVG